jgi:alpha-1,6-mannosyltransferase
VTGKRAWWWPLVAAGVVGEAIYLAITLRLPWWTYAAHLQSWSQLLGGGWGPFAACLAGIGLLAAAYLWGWRLVRRVGAGAQSRSLRRVVWAFAGLYAATVFWLLPITSDLFGYLVKAHLYTDLGQNPLEAAPLEGPLDRFVLAYSGPYGDRSSAYGPAWTLLSAPATLGRHDVMGGLFYLKGLAVAAYLGCVWLVERLLRRLRPDDALLGLYLFAWNPLVVLLAVGDGHNDIVMMVLALLAVWLLLREQWLLAAGVLALSVWIKYSSALLLPLFVLYAWRRLEGEAGARRWGTLSAAGGSAAAASFLVFLPLRSEKRLAGLVERFVQPANWPGSGSGLPSELMILGLALFVLAYLGLLWWLVRRDGTCRTLCHGAFLALLLAFLLGAARSQPWHLIWAAALAGLSDRRWAWPLVAGLSVLMLAVQVWVEWGAPGWFWG